MTSPCENCEICRRGSKTFEGPYTLKQRLLNSVFKCPVKEVKFFECAICQKTFQTRQQLNTHSIIHDEDRYKLLCEFCGKKIHRPNFKGHLAVHTEAFLFPCYYCGKKFRTLSNKRQHEKCTIHFFDVQNKRFLTRRR
jgi:DNA-directed RNA polymerase subunit RPC12/RpoP